MLSPTQKERLIKVFLLVHATIKMCLCFFIVFLANLKKQYIRKKENIFHVEVIQIRLTFVHIITK